MNMVNMKSRNNNPDPEKITVNTVKTYNFSSSCSNNGFNSVNPIVGKNSFGMWLLRLSWLHFDFCNVATCATCFENYFVDEDGWLTAESHTTIDSDFITHSLLQ